MPLSHNDRFRLKSALVEQLTSRAWSYDDVNLLLGEFGLARLEDGVWNNPSVADILGAVSDSDLTELYSVVFGVSQSEVVEVVESDDPGTWKPGYVRLFMSHSALHKEFVGKVANELAVVGIDGFVAHDTMEVNKPWQDQIEASLRSMEAFVAFLHPEFNGSGWCHQETGWALGRRVPCYAIRLGSDPVGFLGRLQWPSATRQSPKSVAALIQEWVFSMPGFKTTINDALFNSLEGAGNYQSAGAAANRIAELNSLTSADFDRLDRIYWSNSQIHNGALPNRALRPLYERYGRAWPPAAPADVEEPPF